MKHLISHDRLVRVRQTQYANEQAKSSDTEDTISLFEDYAFVHEKRIQYGRLERMRKAGKTRGMIEYKQPINFSDKNRQEISLLFHQYEVKENVFRLADKDLIEIRANKVISYINLH